MVVQTTLGFTGGQEATEGSRDFWEAADGDIVTSLADQLTGGNLGTKQSKSSYPCSDGCSSPQTVPEVLIQPLWL